MNYAETLDFLYSRLPVFHRIGAAAYKPGLERTLELLESIGNPHVNFRSIHIAGTNGKGSSSHSLASVLQEAGYKTGLYTSPHLLDFRERIRIDGKMIPEADVAEKVSGWKPQIDEIKPSFFELTVALAFDYFAREAVEIAVIETGMGGRLDSTNVIRPELSLITNIGMDHQQFLGNSISEIAFEKAGIIKEKVPVVISEVSVESRQVFARKAASCCSEIIYASEQIHVEDLGLQEGKRKVAISGAEAELNGEYLLSLPGSYQLKNLPGILASISLLRERGYQIPENAVRKGLEKTKENTGLRGRWDVLQVQPFLVCDIAHNEDGVRELVKQLEAIPCKNLWMVWGMVNDKDHRKVVSLLPKHARMLACQPDIPRALPAAEMQEILLEAGFNSIQIDNVGAAIAHCLAGAGKEDLIFVGGSTFTVASIPDRFFSGTD